MCVGVGGGGGGCFVHAILFGGVIASKVEGVRTLMRKLFATRKTNTRKQSLDSMATQTLTVLLQHIL